jgi:anti-sigma B factor antagonist
MSVTINETKRDNAVVISVSGRVDSNTSDVLEQKLVEIIGRGESRLILDLEHLDYISSAGLRVILKAVKDIKRTNGQLHLCSIKDYIKEVFVLSGFNTFLPIHADVEESLKALPAIA